MKRASAGWARVLARSLLLIGGSKSALGCGWVLGTHFDDAQPRQEASSGRGGQAAAIEDSSSGTGSSGTGSSGAGSSGAGSSGAGSSGGALGHAGAGVDEQGSSGDKSADGGDPGVITDAGSSQCPTGSWRDVELIERTDGAVPAASMALELAAYRDPISGRWCSVVLATWAFVGAIDCPVEAQGLVAFGQQRSSEIGNTPRPVDQCLVDWVTEDAPGIRLAAIEGLASQRPTVTWRRLPRALDERLTVLARDEQGFAIAKRIESSTIEVASREAAWPPGLTAPAFGDDGSLIAFCSLDSCAEPRRCIPLASALQGSPELSVAHAMTGVHFADVNGDNAADAIVINFAGVYVRRGTADKLDFDPVQPWTQDAFYGNAQNLFDDLNGDGRADAIVINSDGVHVRLSTGSAFAPGTPWSGPVGDSLDGFLTADVDGEPGADLVSHTRGSIVVRKARLDHFNATEVWATGIGDDAELRLADVNGDGRADAILIDAHGLQVLVSDGTKFQAGARWFTGTRPGAPGWFFADVNGDRKADAIALDASGSHVLLSNGERFESATGAFERVIPLGQRGNDFADVNADGFSDAIVEEHSQITVYLGSANDFRIPSVWSADAYYGGL